MEQTSISSSHDFQINNCIDQTTNKTRELHRLAIILTEMCNIACPYCYEHREPEIFYNSNHSKRAMSEESAIEILQGAYKLWPKIDALFFFGGEPLLKKNVIKRICQAIENNEIKGMQSWPSFALVTNATLLDDDVINLIEQHEFDINVSLDGPPKVNDLTRIDHKQKGVSEVTLNNLRKLRSRSIKYHIEVTFSKYHLLAGMSVPDLMDYFYQEHGINILHAPWVSASEDDLYHLTDDEIFAAYEPAIRYSIENLRKGIPKVIFFVNEWLSVLRNYDPNAGRGYCPACFSDISVNPGGDIYPCFMFNGFQYLKIGNVFDGEFFANLNQAVIEGFHHSIFAPCDCPPEYQPFHSGCVGADRIATNSILAKPYCNVQTKLVEVFLEEISKG